MYTKWVNYGCLVQLIEAINDLEVLVSFYSAKISLINEVNSRILALIEAYY